MKYRNKKTNGFDSKRESKRALDLQLLEKIGAISNLRYQVPLELIPKQYDGKTLLERECKWIADFVYVEDGAEVWEDCKGFRTPDYKIKRKLALFRHGIRIRET